jgi:replicative DNA helicase
MAYRPSQEEAKKITSVTPPHSMEAEQAVLGAALKSSEAVNRAVDIIRDAADFYIPKHQIIYRAMLDLYERSEACDITTVAALLQSRGELDKIGGHVYLFDLTERVASVANVASYANIVLERGVLRRLISTSNEIIRSCHSQELPA